MAEWSHDTYYFAPLPSRDTHTFAQEIFPKLVKPHVEGAYLIASIAVKSQLVEFTGYGYWGAGAPFYTNGVWDELKQNIVISIRRDCYYINRSLDVTIAGELVFSEVLPNFSSKSFTHYMGRTDDERYVLEQFWEHYDAQTKKAIQHDALNDLREMQPNHPIFDALRTIADDYIHTQEQVALEDADVVEQEVQA